MFGLIVGLSLLASLMAIHAAIDPDNVDLSGRTGSTVDGKATMKHPRFGYAANG